MRRPLVAVLSIFVLTALAAERVIDDTDENSEDIFEKQPRLESIDNSPPTETGVSPQPGEIQFHRRGHAGFGVADDDAQGSEENQGSDGFPRMTAMVDEPSIMTNETAKHLLPLPSGNEDRPLDGIRTDTRSGAKKVVAPFPTLLANTPPEGEKETIIELTIAPNTSMSGFGSALAEGEHTPVMEYDIEESAGKSDESEEQPVERNLTAAVVFHSKDSTSTTTPASINETTTQASTTDTVTPHASHFPTRDRAGIFPSESTEQLTSHGRPTEPAPAPVHVTTKTAEPVESTDPPFAVVDPTIFNPDHLFAVPGAPGIEELPEEVKEEIDEEDSELKKALSSEAHLPTSTVDSIMTSIGSTLAPVVVQETSTSTTTLTSTTTPVPVTTTATASTAAPVTLPTTTPFRLAPIIVPSSTASPPTPSTEPTTEWTTQETTTRSPPSTLSTTPFMTTSIFPEEPVRMQEEEHENHRETPAASSEEVHFEDRPVETTESMPFDPTAAHFGDSQEEIWRSTHGQQEIDTTTTAPLIAHKTPFHIMVKDLDYIPEFADPDSGKFRKLRDQLLPDFRRHFEKALTDFIAVDLSSIEKERGVVVHGVVYTRNSIVDLYESANKVEAELEANQMRLGGNEIEAGTFTINGINARAPVERVQQSAASADGSIAFIIAGIITVGVIIILIVVFVIILMNNHRRGVGSIKLKEDAEAEAGRRAAMHYGNVNLMSYNSPPPPQPPSTQLLQSLPHVVINTKSGSRPSSTMTSPTTSPPRSNRMH